MLHNVPLTTAQLDIAIETLRVRADAERAMLDPTDTDSVERLDLTELLAVIEHLTRARNTTNTHPTRNAAR